MHGNGKPYYNSTFLKQPLRDVVIPRLYLCDRNTLFAIERRVINELHVLFIALLSLHPRKTVFAKFFCPLALHCVSCQLITVPMRNRGNF